jgi:hypothetical protein
MNKNNTNLNRKTVAMPLQFSWPIRRLSLLTTAAVFVAAASATKAADTKLEPKSLKNVIVYYEPGRFGGWPANNGVWHWGNEILVGFERGYYEAKKDNHSFDKDKPKTGVLARSLDGGETWHVEEPENFVSNDKKAMPAPGNVRFNDPNFAMRIDGSRFFLSYDRGHHWEGPYDLSPFFPFNLTARTDYIVNGKDDCLLFLSAEQSEVKANSYHDRAFCARTTDGGKTFKFVSWMTGEPLAFRSVMPTTVRVATNELVSVLRRRKQQAKDAPDICWIDAYGSSDNGASWQFLSKVADIPIRNGNPPSMTKLLDGRLCVVYGVRQAPYGIRAKISQDNGRTWSDEATLRQDGVSWDEGYVRTITRPDGKIVSIYYIGTKEKVEPHIEATIWELSANH